MKEYPKNTKSKEENKKYYECLRTSTCESFTKGKIYRIIDADNFEAEMNFIDNFHEPNGFGGINHKYFKPSTFNKYMIQERNLRELKSKEIKEEVKMEKIYIVYVVGKESPTRFHNSQSDAEQEAIRLAKKERLTTFVFEAISKFELNDVIRTDLKN
jgi:hypothetical protein